MPYIIRMAPGHITTALGDNAMTLDYRFDLAHQAANQLQVIAECVVAAGGTVTGAGFARWATINDGRDKITYRVIEV
jgi:hypothetical protein